MQLLSSLFPLFLSVVRAIKLRTTRATYYAEFSILSRDSYLLPPLMKSLCTFVIAHEFLKLTMLGLQCCTQRGNFPT